MGEEVVYISKLDRGNGFLLRHEKNKQVLEETVIHNEELLSKMLKGSEKEVEHVYLKKDCLTFCLPPEKHLNRKICFDQYSELRKLPMFSKVFKRAYLRATEPVEVNAYYDAPEHLITKGRSKVAIGAALGLCATLTITALSLSSLENEESLGKDIPTKTVTAKEETVDFEPMISTDAIMEEINSNQTTEELVYNQPNMDLDTQRIIKQVAEEYQVPYRYLMTIADVESDGKFDNHGVISSSDDYGVMQINKANIPTLCERLNTTPDSILYDDETNIRASATILKDIINLCEQKYGTVNDEEVYGCYNGWINWREKEISRNYVEKALNLQNTIYNDANMVNTEELEMKVSK
mgnify:FL=1